MNEQNEFHNGQIVYTKAFQKSLSGGHRPMSFPGHAVTMLLGHVPQGGADVSSIQVLRGLGQIGLIKLDDVAEFLGQEQAELCIKKLEEKYFKGPQVIVKDPSLLQTESGPTDN